MARRPRRVTARIRQNHHPRPVDCRDGDAGAPEDWCASSCAHHATAVPPLDWPRHQDERKSNRRRFGVAPSGDCVRLPPRHARRPTLLEVAPPLGANKRLPLELEEGDTYADEVVGYAVASVGFYAQWNWGFGLPFPLSLLMWPFDGLEWYVRYTITSDGPIA